MAADSTSLVLGGAIALAGGVITQLVTYTLGRRTATRAERRDCARAVGRAQVQAESALERAFTSKPGEGDALLREAAERCREVIATELAFPGTARLREALSHLAGSMEEIYLHPFLFDTSPPESPEQRDDMIRVCFGASRDVDRQVARYVGGLRWYVLQVTAPIRARRERARRRTRRKRASL